MKIALTFFTFLFYYTALSAETNELVESHIIKEKNIKIILSKPKGCDDCGKYESLEIVFPNGVTKKYEELTGDKIRSSALDEGGSELGKFLRLYKANENSYFILSMSEARPINAVRIIQVDSTDAKVIFEEDSFEFHKITDYDKDGSLDLLEEGGKGEPESNTHSAYDPYLVYTAHKKNKWFSFKLSVQLSQKWSRENQFLWHGAKYNWNVKVDKNGRVKK